MKTQKNIPSNHERVETELKLEIVGDIGEKSLKSGNN